jgi:succinate dehydrogenase / fumarate reductase iron-sulfur subunit
MPQFRLPQNSKVRPGKTFAAPSGASNVRVFRIYRFDPDTAENPRVDTYSVDMDRCGPMVLDALIKIKNEIDPTLTFRRSCREGICGSCAMNIDGTNTLACTKATGDVRGDVRIYPLPHMPVIKDLAGPHELRGTPRSSRGCDPYAAAAGRERLQAKEDEEKIDMSAHPVRVLLDELSGSGGTATAPGPAALLAAYRWIIDTRRSHGRALDDLEDPFGCIAVTRS